MYRTKVKVARNPTVPITRNGPGRRPTRRAGMDGGGVIEGNPTHGETQRRGN